MFGLMKKRTAARLIHDAAMYGAKAVGDHAKVIVAQEMEKLRKRHQDEVDALKAERDAAIRDRDRAVVEILDFAQAVFRELTFEQSLALAPSVPEVVQQRAAQATPATAEAPEEPPPQAYRC